MIVNEVCSHDLTYVNSMRDNKTKHRSESKNLLPLNCLVSASIDLLCCQSSSVTFKVNESPQASDPLVATEMPQTVKDF